MIKRIAFIITTCFVSLVAAKEQNLLEELTEQIEQNEFKQMTSVVVAKNGAFMYEKYFNQGSQKHKNDMRSASKSLTSLALGLAINDGYIKNVNQSIYPFFEDKQPIKNPDQRKAKIIIEDLLTMSSILECDDWNSASRGNEERMYLIEDWSQFILDLPVKGTPPWKKTPQNSKYGRAFSYCTGGVQLLTDLIERVAQMKLSDYLQNKLFKPLNITPPEFSETPLGVTNGGGGVKMTSRDWIKIGQLMLNKGQFQKQQLVNQKWVSQSWQRRAEVDSDRQIEYGYLWWIFDFEVNQKNITAFAASGNGGNYMFMLPEFNTVVVITSTAYNTSYMHQQSQQILTDYIIPSLLNE